MKLKIDVNGILTEDRLALLPRLTDNETKILAYCIIYTGMKSVDNSFKKLCDGHFYRSNKDFMKDVGMSKTSFMRGIDGLMSKGLLRRRAGSYEKRRVEGVGASEYIIPNELTEWHPLKNRIEDSKDFSQFSLSDLKVKTKVDPDNIDNNDKLILDNIENRYIDNQDKLIKDNLEKREIENNNNLEKEKTFVEEFEEREGITLNRYLYNLFQTRGIESVENWYNTNVVYFKTSADFKKYNDIASALNAQAYPIASTFNEAGAKASKKFDKEMAASMRGVEGGFALCNVNELV